MIQPSVQSSTLLSVPCPAKRSSLSRLHERPSHLHEGLKDVFPCASLFPGWVPNPSLSLPTLPLRWVVILDSFVLMPPFYQTISFIPAFIISLLSQGLIQSCISRTGSLLPPSPSKHLCSSPVPHSEGRNRFASQKASGVTFI